MTLRSAHSLLALVLALSPVYATAAPERALDPEPWYFGASIGNGTYDEESVPTYTLSDSRFRVGYQFSDYLSAELHYGLGGTDEQTVSSNTVELTFENYMAAFVRGTLPFKNTIAYGLAGAALVDVKTVNSGTGTTDGTEESVAFGAGVELYGSESTAITFEWTRYLQKDNFTYDRIGIGFNTYFGLPEIER